MRDYDSMVNAIAGALGGRRIYAWLWFHAVIWSMFLFALTGPTEQSRYEGKIQGLLCLAALSTSIFAALVIRALVTGTLFGHFFSKSAGKKPSSEICIFIRYVIPVLCLGSSASRWFFNWYLE